MAAWVVCVLCALVIVKPQELVPGLTGVPLLHIAFGLALLLAAVDILRGRLRLSLAPQVPYVLAFALWAVVTTAVKSRPNLVGSAQSLAIVMGVFLSVALCAATSEGVRAISLTFLGCVALVTSVALAQCFQPEQCMLAAPEDWAGWGQLTPDGRPCREAAECRERAPVPGGNYRCERPGPLGTSTTDGRIRYRGALADPNELSLTAALAVPLAMALAERGRRARRAAREPLRVWPAVRALLAAAFVAAVGAVVVLSRSRTGLIVYLVVLGLYAVRRCGAWGVVLGCLVGPPMALLGGRGGAEAAQSADERVALLREGLRMIRQSEGIGVGFGQFGEVSAIGMNAHNAYIKAAAEVGIAGACLFALALYASLKVPFAVWFGGYKVDATLARLAPALFISLCGALVGIFFLSWAYKDILYIAIGASAALHGAARAQDARVRVGLSLREITLVSSGMIALLAVVYVVLRLLG